MRALARTSRAALIAAVALLTFAALCLAPTRACAWFNEMTSDNPAQQDIGEYGDVILPDEIPDGTYTVPARTSSRMCIIYASYADAEARSNKEHAVITVSGGTITAQFYLSSAYTHIFYGTQEEAVLYTSEDGTDDSAYVAGNPREGYVPSYFTMNVPALNWEFQFSAYNGASDPKRGLAAGVWYTRDVVFKPSAELLNAIEQGGGSPDPGDSQNDPDPADQPATPGGDQPSDGQQQAPAPAAPTGNAGNGGGQGNGTGAGAGDGAGEGAGSTDGADQAAQDAPAAQAEATEAPAQTAAEPEQQTAEAAEPQVVQATDDSVLGQVMRFAGLDAPDAGGGPIIVLEDLTRPDRGPGVAAAVAALGAACLVAGAAWRTLRFRRATRPDANAEAHEPAAQPTAPAAPAAL